MQFSSLSNFVPPTPAEVQATITTLTNELSRIQSQITTVNSQITAKQNEITATENEIVSLQNLISSLESDKVYWQNQYNYWKGEYIRLDGILNTASWDMAAAMSSYNTDRGKLQNVGRSDVPSNIDASNMATLLSNLKTKIQAEYASIPSTPKT